MALFTVVLEFDGGTYISQFKASSPHEVAVKHAAHVLDLREMGTAKKRRLLADRLSLERPVAISGVRKVWCCSASVGRKLALVNIVATV